MHTNAADDVLVCTGAYTLRQSLADIVLHHPSGRRANVHLLGELRCRDAFLILTHTVDGPEPSGVRSPGLVKIVPAVTEL